MIMEIVRNKLATTVKSISGSDNVTFGVVDDFTLDTCGPIRIRFVGKFWHFVVTIVAFAEFFADSKINIVGIRKNNG